MPNENEVYEALKYRIEVNEYGTRMYHNSAGQLHRIDGPAIENADGSKFWYQNGQPHRTDGPAVVYSGGYKAWYINGEELTEAEFNQAVKNV